MDETTFLEQYATAIEAFLALGGLALHMVMKWAEHRRDVARISLKAFALDEYPAQTAVAVVGAVLAFVGMLALGWMNPGMAIACGYMGNSVAENLANKYAAGK
jgi:predicted transporter